VLRRSKANFGAVSPGTVPCRVADRGSPAAIGTEYSLTCTAGGRRQRVVAQVVVVNRRPVSLFLAFSSEQRDYRRPQ